MTERTSRERVKAIQGTTNLEVLVREHLALLDDYQWAVRDLTRTIQKLESERDQLQVDLDKSSLGDAFDDLHAQLTQQAWDMRSLEITIENLRAENRRFREALEFYACDDTYLPVMEGDGTPITGTVVVLHDGGHIARVALGYEEETWFNPRDAAYPDRFIAHAQSDIPALLKTIAELREALEFYAAHGGERARAALAEVDGEGE